MSQREVAQCFADKSGKALNKDIEAELDNKDRSKRRAAQIMSDLVSAHGVEELLKFPVPGSKDGESNNSDHYRDPSDPQAKPSFYRDYFERLPVGRKAKEAIAEIDGRPGKSEQDKTARALQVGRINNGVLLLRKAIRLWSTIVALNEMHVYCEMLTRVDEKLGEILATDTHHIVKISSKSLDEHGKPTDKNRADVRLYTVNEVLRMKLALAEKAGGKFSDVIASIPKKTKGKQKAADTGEIFAAKSAEGIDAKIPNARQFIAQCSMAGHMFENDRSVADLLRIITDKDEGETAIEALVEIRTTLSSFVHRFGLQAKYDALMAKRNAVKQTNTQA